MPAGLKKRSTQLLPEGEEQNVRLVRAYPNKQWEDDHKVHISGVVADGPYEGEPIEDDLNISTSTKNPGTFFINSNMGKMFPVLNESLTDNEYNTLVDKLAEVGDRDKDAMLEVCAQALDNASNPVFRAVIIHSKPEDPKKNPPYNKLSKEGSDIHPYMDPKVEEETYRKAHGDGSLRDAQKAASTAKEAAQAANNAEIDELASDENNPLMKEASD